MCFCKQKTAYYLRISDWSSDVCSSDLLLLVAVVPLVTTLPVLPDLAFALLIAWRLYRPDMVAPWAGLPLGIVAAILTGQPVGVSATVWPLALLALAIIEPRFPLRRSDEPVYGKGV